MGNSIQKCLYLPAQSGKTRKVEEEIMLLKERVKNLEKELMLLKERIKNLEDAQLKD